MLALENMPELGVGVEFTLAFLTALHQAQLVVDFFVAKPAQFAQAAAGSLHLFLPNEPLRALGERKGQEEKNHRESALYCERNLV